MASVEVELFINNLIDAKDRLGVLRIGVDVLVPGAPGQWGRKSHPVIAAQHNSCQGIKNRQHHFAYDRDKGTACGNAENKRHYFLLVSPFCHRTGTRRRVCGFATTYSRQGTCKCRFIAVGLVYE